MHSSEVLWRAGENGVDKLWKPFESAGHDEALAQAVDSDALWNFGGR